MTYRFDGFNWLVRLQKGERLVDALTEFCQKENVSTGWIFGIGASKWAELGFYKSEKRQYQWKKFPDRLEILSLQGSIALVDGEPSFHIHGTFSDDKMNSFGGHVKDLEVLQTVELFVHRWYSDSIKRKYDDETGLKLLDL